MHDLIRLTQVSHFAGFSTANNQTFTLTAVGAITGITTGGVLQNQTVNSENQITAIGSAAISYDSNGNVTTDDQGQTLIWDAWNRLVGVENSSGQLIATYTYDGLGRIASETSIDPDTLTTTTTDLYYAGGQEVEERTGVTDGNGNNLSSNGSTTLVNVFSPMDGNILLRDEGGTRLYFTHDITGDVTAALNTSGSVLQRQEYTAEGDVTFLNGDYSLKEADDYGLVYLWQNGRRGAITQMYKFGFRWYTPSLQWLSFDPDGYVDGADAYINREDGPTGKTDPNGLFVKAFVTRYFGGGFTAAEKAMVIQADKDATDTLMKLQAVLANFDLNAYVAAHKFEPDPKDLKEAKDIIDQIGSDAQDITKAIAGGWTAAKLCIQHTWLGLGGAIVAESVPNSIKDPEIWFGASFFTHGNAWREETIIHEFSHIVLGTSDEDLADAEAALAKNDTRAQRAGRLDDLIGTAYWWEAITTATPAVAVQDVLKYVFRPAGTPGIPDSTPINPVTIGYPM